MLEFIIPILFYLIGIFVLYIVIETGVRRGVQSAIDDSVLGKYLEKKLNDLDKNKN